MNKPVKRPERGHDAPAPRNQLLDERALFNLFREREKCSIKLLREKTVTQQPETRVYLKELSDVATLHLSGEFNGTWELMPTFEGDGVCLTVVLIVGCNELIFFL
jgi:transcription initiation factor TFIIF subunit beta